jgi:hypothetical protein
MSRFAVANLLFGTALASYDVIAGYRPETDVVPHSAVDRDMQEINTLAGSYDFDAALFVYENGGNGKCSATDISGAASGDSCFGKTTDNAKGNSVKGSGEIRTLMGFATCGSTCETKLGAEKWYNVYKNYWNDPKYADTYVRGPSAGNPLAGRTNKLKAEIIKKGVAYQAVWMYVLHEFEDAIMDCLSGNIYDNEASNAAGDSPHAWDEGWAFYAGSLEGTAGTSGSGAMLYTLAEKRCKDFGTCSNGINADGTGTAKANDEALRLAKLGRDKILIRDCNTVQQEYDKIVDQMTVPLIQGMLKYAYKSDPAVSGVSCDGQTAAHTADCEKAWAEGWAFAAAVLPRLHYCDDTVATMVKENLDVIIPAGKASQMSAGFAAVKTKVETAYACLGITCDMVGEFQNTAGVYTGMEKCTDQVVTADGAVTDASDLGGGALIAGYMPATNVVPHSKVDLDMQEINTAVGLRTTAGFDDALFIYTNGGNGKCSATDISGAASGDPCSGKTTDNAKGNSVKGSGEIRTLKGFATCGSTCETKLGAEKWYNVYKNYWNDPKYADTYVQGAYTAPLLTRSSKLRAEVFKKGVAYQVVWMYVLHEYEDAIADCLAGNIFDNEASNVAGDSPHAWDEGWAFYAGSLEGTAGTSGSGAMVYTLAEKRCKDFGTCTNGINTDGTGTAKANVKHLLNARRGRNKILAGDCYTVVGEFDAIVDQMTVPLIQGMLKYAYKSDPAVSGVSCDGQLTGHTDDCEKAWAEGWAFAAAVLPRLNYCSTTADDVAKLVKDNLNLVIPSGKASQMADGYAALKEAVESLYPCLGITCEDVGEFQTSAGVYAGMEGCADPTQAPATTAATTEAPVGEESGAALLGLAAATVLLNA